MLAVQSWCAGVCGSELSPAAGGAACAGLEREC